jgi:tetratricopeptide (TPR) repeat protein
MNLNSSISLCAAVLLLVSSHLASAGSALSAVSSNTPPEAPPATPREFYNAGTRKLSEEKLREAEALLETALGSQKEALQPMALYNLGHVRFQQGVAELKKGPPTGPAADRGRKALQAAEQALRQANDALGGNELDKLVASYMHGRGARKELSAATKAVKRAMESLGAVLSRWQRASGDFKSAHELNPKDSEAKKNADTMDRYIAKLVDSLQELQQMANAMGDKKKELGEKMKDLKGRIPEPDMPPGAAGDEEEEEDQPDGPKPGDQEGPTKQGEEARPLSPEMAGWLLDGFKLGGDKRLPMGGDQEAQPRDRAKPTW